MKDRLIKELAMTAITFTVITGILLYLLAASILEADAIVHGRQASAWYVSVLNTLSIRDFS